MRSLWLAINIALALTPLIPSRANAGYVFDRADLPANYKCGADRTKVQCTEDEREEAWWARYGEAYGQWYSQLTTNTNCFFAPGASDRNCHLRDSTKDEEEDYRREGLRSPNIIDAVYGIALRQFGGGWTFAIDEVCEGGLCAPKLRMVSAKDREDVSNEVADTLDNLFATSPAELATELRLSHNWEEADLRSCPGAISQLLKFQPQSGAQLWSSDFVQSLKGKPKKAPEEIVITADGDSVLVRARGVAAPGEFTANAAHVAYFQANHGEVRDWALKLVQVVRPCLRPSGAIPPWDRLTKTAQSMH